MRTRRQTNTLLKADHPEMPTVALCVHIYIYIYCSNMCKSLSFSLSFSLTLSLPIYIYIYIYNTMHIDNQPQDVGWSLEHPQGILTDTVSFHNFKSQNLKSSVSNPKSKYVAYLSALSQISNCQGLGRKNKYDILKTDRTSYYAISYYVKILYYIILCYAILFDK